MNELKNRTNVVIEKVGKLGLVHKKKTKKNSSHEFLFISKIIASLLYKLDTLLLKQMKLPVLDIATFLFPQSYSDEGICATHLDLRLGTRAEKETRYIQYRPFLLFQWYSILYIINTIIQVTSKSQTQSTRKERLSIAPTFALGIYLRLLMKFSESNYTLSRF